MATAMRAMTRKPARTLVVLLAAAMVAAFGVASPARGGHVPLVPVVAPNPVPAVGPVTITGAGCLGEGHGTGGTLAVDVLVVSQAGALVAGPVTGSVTGPGAYGPLTLTIPASTPPTNLTAGSPSYGVVVLCYRERGNGAGYDDEGTGTDPDGTDFSGVGALAAGDDLLAVQTVPLVVLPCVLNCGGGGGGGGGAPSEVSGLGGFDDLGAATPIDGVPRFTG